MKTSSKPVYLYLSLLSALLFLNLSFTYEVLGVGIFFYLLSLLCAVLFAPSRRQLFYFVLLVGVINCAIQLNFFYGLFKTAAIPLYAILAIWVALPCLLTRILLDRFGHKAILCFPFMWTACEFFRSELYYLKFSWLSGGMALSHPFYNGLPGLFGFYGVSFIFLLIVAVAIVIPKSRYKPFAGLLIIPALCMSYIQPKQNRPGPNVLGVQLEYPFEQQVLAHLEKNIERYPETELIVLSEYSFPGDIPASIREFCKTNNVYLIAGGKVKKPGSAESGIPMKIGKGKKGADRNWYNTAFVINPQGETEFTQVKSVPIQFFNDGLPAPKQELWKSPWGKIGLAICYDLSYSKVMDELISQGAEALIIPTMDAIKWGEYEHRLHAKMPIVRAREYGIEIFRVASSGISQHVSARGKLLAETNFPGQGEQIYSKLLMHPKATVPVDRAIAYLSIFFSLIAMAFLLIKKKSLVHEKPIESEELVEVEEPALGSLCMVIAVTALVSIFSKEN